MRKVYDGRLLPVGGRDYNLLDMLLEPLIHVDQDTGERIVLKTTRQKIEQYWHLIYEPPQPAATPTE